MQTLTRGRPPWNWDQPDKHFTEWRDRWGGYSSSTGTPMNRRHRKILRTSRITRPRAWQDKNAPDSRETSTHIQNAIPDLLLVRIIAENTRDIKTAKPEHSLRGTSYLFPETVQTPDRVEGKPKPSVVLMSRTMHLTGEETELLLTTKPAYKVLLVCGVTKNHAYHHQPPR